MGKGLVIGIFVVIIVILIFAFVSNSSDEGTATTDSDENSEVDSSALIEGGDGEDTVVEMDDDMEDDGMMDEEEMKEAMTSTVEMSSTGFSPSTLTVSAGDTVNFVAMDDSGRWPASAIHPTHASYPGSVISKCGTAEESMIFDSCSGVLEGETYSFIFNEVGEWGYHDHLSPGKTGKIIVG